MRIAATGHRPPRLGLSYGPADNKLLTMFAKQMLTDSMEGYENVSIISGMAQGWDQAVAHAAILLNLPLIAALPFEGQESRWPYAGRKRYDAILGHAEEVVTVSKGGFDSKKYLVRDEWMVNNCDAVLALWDGTEEGGTYYTVRYAKEFDIPYINAWIPWESYAWKEKYGGKPVR